MRRALRWLGFGLGALAAILALAAAAGFVYLRSSLPQTTGELAVGAVEQPVEVLRDRDGIVTIRARSLHDAYVALGFVHAQDRLAQMEVMRRVAAGRLSEALGPATLTMDRFMRVLDLYGLAEAQVEHLDGKTRDALSAYAAGVNAYLREHDGARPPELIALGIEPRPWRPADSLAWLRLMALKLSGNWRQELVRAQLAGRLRPEQIDTLWPGYPDDAPVTMPALAAYTADLPLAELAAALPRALRPTAASNAWVVSGAHTQSGRPILANDPHLELKSPGQWYLVRIETPEATLAGATAPGFPFHVLGHNRTLAWGLTTTHSDTQDFFVEKLDGEEPGRYLAPDGPRAFETRREIIEVRGGEPVELTVRATRHGPVLSDVLPARVAGEDRVLALAWPALRADDRTPDALRALNRAASVAEGLEAMGDAHAPQQNVLLADSAGHIGFAAPARVPIRRAGDGRAPVPGWSGRYDWRGYVPVEALPHLVDPPSGRIVNANNRIVDDDYPYLIAADWPPPYRAERIDELLDAADGPLTRADMGAIQLDVASPAAGRLLPLLLETEPSGERAGAAHELLAAWDGGMRREQEAPLVFVAWLDHLNRRLLADELGPAFEAFGRPDVAVLHRVLTGARAWCDDTRTTASETCEGQAVAALDDALAALGERFGDDMRSWRWGAAHVAAFPHPLISRVPGLDRLLGFGLPSDGGDETLNRGGAAYSADPAHRYGHRHGATFRAVMDLADPDASDMAIATGQSGNPLAASYGGFVRRWRDGVYVKLVGDTKDDTRRLLLNPRPSRGGSGP